MTPKRTFTEWLNIKPRGQRSNGEKRIWYSALSERGGKVKIISSGWMKDEKRKCGGRYGGVCVFSGGGGDGERLARQSARPRRS